MHSFHYHQGQLRCEGVDLAGLATEHSTPLYVYSAQTIRDHYRRLDAALDGLDHLICYAVKANSNLAVLNLLSRERSGFDIVSAGELFRVVHAGGKPECCTFAGVGKTREEIEYALRQGVLSFNVESEAELEMINAVARDLNRRAPVALRINPNVDAGGHKYISTGKSENKFGVGINRALEVYQAASRMEHVRLRGVQMHIGSQITEAGPFAQAVKKVAPVAAELKREYGIEFFSVGGGLGIVYKSSLQSGQEAWWRHDAGTGDARADRRRVRRGHRADAQALGPAHPAGAGAVHGRQRGRLVERGAISEDHGQRQKVRHRRCGHERPHPARALRGLSRDRAGG